MEAIKERLDEIEQMIDELKTRIRALEDADNVSELHLYEDEELERFN